MSSLHVALLGGAFDPPHLGHAYAVNAVLHAQAADQVWLLPSGARWDKLTQVETSHRVAMVRLMAEEFFPGDPRVQVCEDDAVEKDPHRGTAGLLSEMAARHPANRFSFVIGHELIADLPKWKNQEELKRRAHFLTIIRHGTIPGDSPEGFDITRIDSGEGIGVAISSTALRTRLQKGEEVRGLIPSSVWSYIVTHSLYRGLPRRD